MLEEYLHDPEFEVNRRQYLLEQEAKSGRPGSSSKPTATQAVKGSTTQETEIKGLARAPSQAGATAAQPVSRPSGPQTFDFFAPIDAQPTYVTPQRGLQAPGSPQQMQVQDALAQYRMQQATLPQLQTGFNNQSPFGTAQAMNLPPNSFGPSYNSPMGLQPQNSILTGFGNNSMNNFMTQSPTVFSGSSLGSIPQGSQVSFQSGQQLNPQSSMQPQPTNPFRQSMLLAQNTQSQQTMPTGGSFSTSTDSPVANKRNTNPFAQFQQTGQPIQSPFASMGASNQSPFASTGTNNQSPFANASPISGPQFQQQQQHQQAMTAPIQPMATGTNPFARALQSSQPPPAPLAPNSTGATNPFRAFTSQNSWPSNQGTIGGMEPMPNLPVFPQTGPAVSHQQFQPQQQDPWAR
jgi:hypothetical protein